MPEHPPFPFVIGCGRSGTTLVRAMLDAHPEMAVPYESYFPVWFARHRARYERSQGFSVERFVDDFVAHDTLVRWDLQAHDVRTKLRAAAPADFPDAIRACFAAYAEAQDKPRYADKTPIFVLHIPVLAAMFPEAVFVHMVRDGRDVALSRVEAAWGTHRFEHEALLWRSQVERGRTDGRALGAARYCEIHYEALLDDPERIARELCSFIGLAFDPAMLRYHENAEALIASQPFPDEHRNLSRPPTKGLRSWQAELTPSQVVLFDALAGDALQHFGYERGADAIPTGTRLRAMRARTRYTAITQYRRARSALWRAVHRDAAT